MSGKPKGLGKRSMSGRNLSKDMEMISHYARKYSNPNVKPAAYYGNQNRMKRNNTFTSNMIMNTSNGGNYGNHDNRNRSGYGNGNAGKKFDNFMNPYALTNANSYGGTRISPCASPGFRGRRDSNLMKGSSEWDSSHVSNESEDMSNAIVQMINNQNGKIAQQMNFMEELQRLSQDKDFCRVKVADEWSYKEVCYWLTTIHLDKYIATFKRQIIDGSILLRDLDEQMLTHELGIKRLHVKKLLREITKLRNLSPKFKKPSENSRDALIESLRSEMGVIKQENKRLKQEIATLRTIANNGNNNANSNINWIQ